MMGANVLISSTGTARFRGLRGDVCKQTVLSLERKGWVEDIADLIWCGSEYQITDAGREVIGEYVSPLVKKELKRAIAIMDEKGESTAGGDSRMLWWREWDTVRQCLVDALELLEGRHERVG